MCNNLQKLLILFLIPTAFLASGCKSKKGGNGVAQSVSLSSSDSCTVELRMDLQAGETDEDFDVPTAPGVEISGNQTVTASNCEGIAVGDVFALSDAESPGVAKAQRYVEGTGQKLVINFDTKTAGTMSYFTANGQTLTAALGTACAEGIEGTGQFISGQTTDYKITIRYKITFKENACTPDRELNFTAI